MSLRQRTHDGVDKMMDKVEDIQEKSQGQMSDFKEKAAIMRENFTGYIKENPEKSVLIAAGVGLAAGTIIAAMFMRRRN